MHIKSRLLLLLAILCLLLPFLSFASEKGPALIVLGTRPEVIKLMPVYEALKKENIPVLICTTEQHLELANEIFELFKIKPDFSLNIMKPNQELSYIAETAMNRISALLKEVKPSVVIVQGDTSSAMVAALAAFYQKIPVAHVEAGLRTYNIYAPFPEEINRQLISRLATFHFAPTAVSVQQLIDEGVPAKNVYQTGNTIVDALYMVKKKIKCGEIAPNPQVKEIVKKVKGRGDDFFLLTAHRRESFGEGLEIIMKTIGQFLKEHPHLTVFYPVHPNPAILTTLEKVELPLLPNVVLSPPIPYNDLVYLLMEADGVLTDSGGIQEEAVSLNKMTLVLRNETDRPEALESGIARLVGTNPQLIQQGMNDLLMQKKEEGGELKPSPYGDGKAAERIANIIKNFYIHP